MKPNLSVKVVGDFGKYPIREGRPSECVKCGNAVWSTILVKTSSYWEEDRYVCLECLLKVRGNDQ